jgi:methionyl aminopeptidase
MASILQSDELAVMQQIGKIAGSCLRRMKRLIRPGITTKDIECYFENIVKSHPDIVSAFAGYNGYPASICVSVNEEIIHGIPSSEKRIAAQDLVSVDLGLKSRGLFVDCAFTYPAGRPSALGKKLLRVGRRALQEGIAHARIGATIGDIGYAIQKYVEDEGLSVVRKFVGHGIGRALHCPPEVPNFGVKGEGQVLEEGMVLAIEPMISSGSHEVIMCEDGWTAVTADSSLSSHFEHTVAITRRGPRVLTQ